MKRLIIFLGLFLFVSTSFVSAQESKLRVAVFDPTISGSDFDEGTGVIIREMVSSALVNTGKYIIIERSLIDKILKEQKFSNSGAVDDSQISQIGKLAGANKVVLSVISSAGNKGLLSLKMIDVESASIENQKTQLVDKSKILDIITPLALEMIGEQNTTTVASGSEKSKGGSASVGEVIGAGIGGLLGKKNNNSSSSSVTPAKSNRDQFAERMNQEEGTDFSVSSGSSGNGSIELVFNGFSYGKNPDAMIYVDGVHVGNGTLNQGFSVFFSDNNPGKHQVKIEWSGTVTSKNYEIYTGVKKRFIFDYVKTGFGYDFQLKK